MKKRLCVIIPSVLFGISLLFNIYAITILNNMKSQINENMANVAGHIGIYGSSLINFLENPSSDIHHRLELQNDRHHFINRSLNFRYFRKLSARNYSVMQAVNRVSRHTYSLEGGFRHMRLDSEHDSNKLAEKINEKLGEESRLFLENYAKNLMLFSENVRAYYAIIDNRRPKIEDNSTNKLTKKELQEKIARQSEEIQDLHFKWMEEEVE